MMKDPNLAIQQTNRTFPKSVQPGIPKLPKKKAGWNPVKMGDLVDEVVCPLSMDDDTEYLLLTVKRSRGGVIERQRLLGCQIAVKSQFLVKEDDFLISKRQIVHGACGVVPKELSGSIVSNEYSVLRCKPLLDLSFLKYLTYTVYFQQTCFHSSTGVHIEKMIFKLEDWLQWKFDIPVLREQKKISEFLEAVDQKLASLRRKQGLLSDYKRNAMQKIFSQKIRFKRNDGSDFPDWKEEKFGKIYEWVNTNNCSREMLTYESGTIQNIHYGDIHTKFKAQFRQEQEQVPYIRLSAMQKSLSEELFCRRGDLVIADASEDYEDIGKAVEILSVKPNSLVAGLHTYIARPKNSEIAVGYSGYMFRSTEMRKQIMRIAQGISVLGVSKGNLSKLSLFLPHPEEQRIIADFLSAIDTKIDAVSEQISYMEDFKKGLLQKIFM